MIVRTPFRFQLKSRKRNLLHTSQQVSGTHYHTDSLSISEETWAFQAPLLLWLSDMCATIMSSRLFADAQDHTLRPVMSYLEPRK